MRDHLSVNAAGVVINILFLIAAVYIYASLLRQIRLRRSTVSEGVPPLRSFGLAEVLLAAGIVGWLGINVAFSALVQSAKVGTGNLIMGAVFTVALMAFMLLFLKLRGFDLSSAAGLEKIGFGRVIATGLVLLFAAYPLIIFADLITQRFFGAGSSKQTIVELFNASQSIEQRMLIIFIAVVIAPAAEEFIFRFFIYGVLKQYAGAVLALIASALLFAGVHAHVPSFAPLFVLAGCFTVAYEWSGSLLVPMTMHSIFNSLSLIALAFPETFRQ